MCFRGSRVERDRLMTGCAIVAFKRRHCMLKLKLACYAGCCRKHVQHLCVSLMQSLHDLLPDLQQVYHTLLQQELLAQI